MTVDKVMYRVFHHPGAGRYEFNYKPVDRVDVRTNQSLQRLGNYFTMVHDGRIPNLLFQNPMVYRASRMKIKGLSKTQKAFLLDYLFDHGHICRVDESPLPSRVQEVFKNFKDAGVEKKPNHDPVLANILKKQPDAVATELPVWKVNPENFSKSMTGHIDLVGIGTLNDESSSRVEIKVMDYKPEGERNFIFSIPQVSLYGKMLQDRIGLDGRGCDDDHVVTCYIFDKKAVWRFQPSILGVLTEKMERLGVLAEWDWPVKLLWNGAL